MRDRWEDLSDVELTARLRNKTDFFPLAIKGLVEFRDDDEVAADIELLLNPGEYS